MISTKLFSTISRNKFAQDFYCRQKFPIMQHYRQIVTKGSKAAAAQAIVAHTQESTAHFETDNFGNLYLDSPSVSVFSYKTQDLTIDDDELQAVYRIWKQHVTTKYSITDFKKKVVDTFQTAFLFHDPVKDTMRGCLFGTVDRNKVCQGKRVTTMELGLGFVEKDFRKVVSPMYNQVFMDFQMEELVNDPFKPVYLFCKTFTYRGYMLATRFHEKNSFPWYTNKGIPAFERSLLDDFGTSAGGELYDPITGIIRKEEIGLKDGVADIEDKHLNNPHIRYFFERNPDWKKGHMLCTISKVTWNARLEYLMQTNYFNHS